MTYVDLNDTKEARLKEYSITSGSVVCPVCSKGLANRPWHHKGV